MNLLRTALGVTWQSFAVGASTRLMCCVRTAALWPLTKSRLICKASSMPTHRYADLRYTARPLPPCLMRRHMYLYFRHPCTRLAC